VSRAPALGSLLLAALLAASVALAAAVLEIRSPDLELEVTSQPKVITPDGDGHDDVAHIEFFVRDGDPAALVQIVGRRHREARTLEASLPLSADRPVEVTWDGRDDAGSPVRPGKYRLRVVLPSRDRDMVYPRPIAVRR
jgi:hypothetical protein